MNKLPKWYIEFKNTLIKIEPDPSKNEKILKLVINLLKAMKKKWQCKEEKTKSLF